MDILFNLNLFSSESIHACIAACKNVDDFCRNTLKPHAVDLSVLKENAGLIPEPVPGSRDALIARGAFEWLREFHDSDKTFSLSNTSVKALHLKLFKYSPRDEGTRGNYRTDIEDDMRSLFEETKNAFSRHDRHPLFVISLFRVAFINLMPFITGNAQCANMLAYALLFENTYPHVSKLPLVAFLNNPGGSVSGEPLVFLPDTMRYLFQINNKPTSPLPGSGLYLNPRQHLLLKCLQENDPLKISDIMNYMPDQNRNTIKKDLQFLKEENLLGSRGEKRGMVYFVVNKEII